MINDYDWRREQARKSLQRILPEVEKTFAKELQQVPNAWHKFTNRLDREWQRLFTYLHQLYGWQYDFFYTLERILHSLVQFCLERPEELKAFDGSSLKKWPAGFCMLICSATTSTNSAIIFLILRSLA